MKSVNAWVVVRQVVVKLAFCVMVRMWRDSVLLHLHLLLWLKVVVFRAVVVVIQLGCGVVIVFCHVLVGFSVVRSLCVECCSW